jgi:hypothetical protein
LAALEALAAFLIATIVVPATVVVTTAAV